MRVALYYAPAPEDPLWQAGCAWLGRDPQAQHDVPQPNIPGLAAATAAPRHYGFHATLKPPMRLSGPFELVQQSARSLAARLPEFDLPPLHVDVIDGFVALATTGRDRALHDHADACVFGLDIWRAPPTAPELAQRRAAGLNHNQEAQLQRWGYPYLFGAWRFHMTLTGRLGPAEADSFRVAAEAHFAAALALPRRVRDIAMFIEDAPGTPLRLAARYPLRA